MELIEVEQSGIAIRQKRESILEPVFYWQLVSNNALLGIRYRAFTYNDKPIKSKEDLIFICRQNKFVCILEDMKSVRL